MIWRIIPGSGGLYEASDEGQIRNAKTEKVLTPSKSNNGRLVVYLSGYFCRTFNVDKLIAKTFVGEGRVKHKDGDLLNNRADNLEVR